MLQKIRYFRAVVEEGNFSRAAEACHISQSAISQQIKALEEELDVQLLERKSRSVTLTEAGDHFYCRTKSLLEDYDALVSQCREIQSGQGAVVRIGILRDYSGEEMRGALAAFSDRFPDVEIEISQGNHEDLYIALREEKLDIILNDQRRAFSDQYHNRILEKQICFIEVPNRGAWKTKDMVSIEEIGEETCILVAPPSQQDTERDYYENVIEFHGDFLFAETLEEARLLVTSGKGIHPVDGSGSARSVGMTLRRIPLYRSNVPIERVYCAFWKRDNSGYYIETFADLLKEQFAVSSDEKDIATGE